MNKFRRFLNMILCQVKSRQINTIRCIFDTIRNLFVGELNLIVTQQRITVAAGISRLCRQNKGQDQRQQTQDGQNTDDDFYLFIHKNPLFPCLYL